MLDSKKGNDHNGKFELGPVTLMCYKIMIHVDETKLSLHYVVILKLSRMRNPSLLLYFVNV